MDTTESEQEYEPRFIYCCELTPCQNKDCDIRSTGLWKMKDGRCVCHGCKVNEQKANANRKDSASGVRVNALVRHTNTMDKYHKIHSIFKRDPNNNYKTFTDEYAKPIFRYLADNKWEFTEKIDGTNIRVMFDGENVVFGGRTKNSQIPTYLLTELQKLFTTTTKRKVFKEKFSDGVCLYGEGYGHKIQKAGSNYLEDSHSFVLFDVKIGDWWLKREDVEDVAKSLGIDVAPIRGYGTIDEAIQMTREGFDSDWGDFTAEGLVLRPAVPVFDRKGERVITKVKHKDFKYA